MIVTARRASAILYNLLRQRGDRRPVLLPANVCPVVPLALREAEQPFRLLDVEEGGAGLDSTACLDLLAADPSGFSGILYVRPYGAVRDVSSFFRAARELGDDLLLIDDRCLCRPEPEAEDESTDDGPDVTLYSTGSRKPVDLGFGGFARLRAGLEYAPATRDFDPAAAEAAEETLKAAVSARRPVGPVAHAWLDTRPLQLPWHRYRAAVIAERRRVEAHRSRIDRIYAERLPAAIQLPADSHHWRFQIRVPEPAALVGRLERAGLFASRHYASLGSGVFSAEEFPRAENLAASIVNLFNDWSYDELRAERTVELILEHLACAAGPPAGRGAPAG